jgi:ribosome biogenesis protein BRX1
MERVGSKPAYTGRTLVLARRTVSPFVRHFLPDFLQLLPQAKKGNKFTGDRYVGLNDIAEGENCTAILFFESSGTSHLLWAALALSGPTICFSIENMHSIQEQHFNGKVSGNSRPMLLFDPEFDSTSVWKTVKEVLKRIFRVNSKPSQRIDCAISFFLADGHIWIQRYQIDWEGEARLEEAGPRLCLKLRSIASGAFCGRRLYKHAKTPPGAKATT